MKPPRRIFTLFCSTLATIASVSGGEAASAANAMSSSTLLPALAIMDESGKSIPLFSTEAYRAEFRYLRSKLHEVDLNGPAIETDGWTHNIAEAEWPFMAFAYFGYASANLAKADPVIRDEALAEMRWLIDALQTPRMSGFATHHFGEPFGTNRINASVFVHGHFFNLALRYRDVSRDTRYDVIIHRVSAALTEAFNGSSQGVLKSYRDMWWISDNLPALSAMARYDRLYQRNSQSVREKFLRSVKSHYLEASTGLLCTYVDADATRQLQGPRGISTMYGLHFLRDVSPEFAADQYRRARQLLVREAFGLAAVREFPEGIEAHGDIDSGPLMLGFGPSASGFAVGAAAVMGDEATFKALLKSSALAGLPEIRSGELRYVAMPPVGQAVILFGKTEQLLSATGSRQAGN